MEGFPWLADAGVELGKWGEIVIDPQTGRSAHPKVYAGGDCNCGAALAIMAALLD